MQPESRIQVLVAGGGVGGLALAGFLQQAGLDPVVAERGESFECPDGAVELWPDAMALLDRLGIGDAVREAGVAVRTWSERRPDGTVRHRLETDDRPGLVIIRYARLRECLHALVPDGALRTRTALRLVEPGNRSVAVEFDTGVREQFDIVVGADGTRSRTRQQLGGAEPVFCGTTSLAFRLPGADLTGANETWLSDGTVFRALPVGEGAMGWLTVPVDAPGHSPGFDPDVDAGCYTGAADPAALVEATSAVDWLGVDPFEAVTDRGVWVGDDLRVGPDRWAEGRIALLGDAAHTPHRVTGVGPTLALEDAAALTSALLDLEESLSSRLAAYATGRRTRRERLFEGVDRQPPLAAVDGAFEPTAVDLRSTRLMASFRGPPPQPNPALHRR